MGGTSEGGGKRGETTERLEALRAWRREKRAVEGAKLSFPKAGSILEFKIL